MQKDTTPEPSKELQEMRQEDVTIAPSLAGMLEGVDLADPRIRELFADLLANPPVAPTSK